MNARPDTTASVSAGDGERIMVSGCLDVHTVAGARDEGVRLLADERAAVFDLSGAHVKGSAAIALLIAWQREARMRDLDMSVVGASEELKQIADACGVGQIIPFDET